MIEEQSQQPVFTDNRQPATKAMKQKLFWLIVIIIVLAIAGFLFSKKNNNSTQQSQTERFFTLGSIIRTDIPAEKLSEYKTRMADAKANAAAPGGDINFRSYMEAASIKKGVGDYEGARDIWEYVNTVRPKNSVSFANLGDLYANFLKDTQKAEANYLKAIENDPSDPAYVRGLLELYQYQLSSRLGFQEAFFRQAVENNTENAEFWLILASYYESAKDYNQAIKAWQEVARIDQNQGSVADAQISRLRSLTK